MPNLADILNGAPRKQMFGRTLGGILDAADWVGNGAPITSGPVAGGPMIGLSDLTDVPTSKAEAALSLASMLPLGKAVRAVKGKATRLRVFHGTDSEPFDKFDPSRIGTATDEGLLGSGFYFSTDPNVTRTFKTKMEAGVDISNPLHIQFPEWGASKTKLVNDAIGSKGLKGSALTEKLREMGYDAVVLDYSPVGYHHREVAVFDPDVISIKKASRK